MLIEALLIVPGYRPEKWPSGPNGTVGISDSDNLTSKWRRFAKKAACDWIRRRLDDDMLFAGGKWHFIIPDCSAGTILRNRLAGLTYSGTRCIDSAIAAVRHDPATDQYEAPISGNRLYDASRYLRWRPDVGTGYSRQRQ
jgi:hypothetical protein